MQQAVARTLVQPRALIFKGGGGEAQRNPLKPCRVAWVGDGKAGEEDLSPACIAAQAMWRSRSGVGCRPAATSTA